MLSRQLIKQFKTFRFVVLKESNNFYGTESVNYFMNLALGNFIISAVKVFGKNNLPLLIATEVVGEGRENYFNLLAVTCHHDHEQSKGKFR